MSIETLNDYNTVRQALAEEMAKPPGEQDMVLVRGAVTQLRAAEKQFGDQVPKASQEAVASGALASQPIEGPRLLPQQEAMAQGVDHRLQQIADAVMRPFRSKEENQRLSGERLNAQAAAELEVEELARRQGVDPTKLGIERTAGSLVPELVAGPAVGTAIRGTRAGSALLRVGAEAGMGALGAVADVPLSEDPTFNAYLGGGLGAGIGLLSEIPGAARNLVLNDAMRALKSPETRRNRALAESAGIDVSLAEASVDQRVARMEQEVSNVPGSPRHQFNQNRQRQIAEQFAKVDELLNPERLSTGQVIAQTRTAYEGHVRELGNIASQNFVESLRPVAKELGATVDSRGRIIGGRRVVQVDNLLEEYRTQLKLGTEAPRSISATQQKELESVVQELEQAAQAGGMTLGRTQQLLKDLTEQAYPTGGTVSRQRQNAVDVLDARALKDAAMADLEATSQAMLPRPGLAAMQQQQGSRAATALATARQQYAADIAVIDELQGQAVDRLLGKVGGSVESEDFVRNLLNLPTRQFNELLGVLDKAKPGLANSVRARVFSEIADKHLRLTARGQSGGAPDLDIVKFINEFDSMPFSRFQSLVGLDAESAARAQNGLKVLRLIAEGPERAATGRGALQKLEELAINLASQNPGFISRLLAGRLGPGFFEKALFSADGLEALETLGTVQGATRTGAAVALTRLAEMAADTDKEREQLLERARQQQTLQSLQNARIGP